MTLAPLRRDDLDIEAVGFLDEALTTFVSLSGFAMDNMTRDMGWRLHIVGRRIERLDNLASRLATFLRAHTETAAALHRHDYVAVLSRLATLRPAVDAFFDAVMVNAEDAAVRGNRLALLKRLSDRFGAIADISQLSTG